MLLIERQALRLKGTTTDAFRSILFSRTDEFEFDSGQGRLLTEQIRLGSSGFRIGRVQSSGHRIGLTEDRHVTALFPKAGSLAVRIVRNEATIAAGQAGLVMPAARQTRVMAVGAAGFEGLVLMVPVDTFARIAADAGVGALMTRDILPGHGAAGRRVSAYLDFLMADVAGHDDDQPGERVVNGMASLLRDLVADWIADAFVVAPDPAAGVSAVDRLRVRRAEEIFHERADDALSIAAVARELGLSLRSLQAAFHAVQGEGPKARLTRIRLDRARERMLKADPDAQVTAIALDCGFTHLSRFAEAYRQTFGERPSDTLARRRMPSARR